MMSNARRLLGAVLATLAGLGSASLRAQGLPPAPVPVMPAAPVGAEKLPPPPDPPSGTALIGYPVGCPLPGPPVPPPYAPPACAPYEDCNGPLLRGDPLLDRLHYPPPGWFAAFELGIVGPHVKNGLFDSSAVGAAPFVSVAGGRNRMLVSDLLPNPIHVPGADLDWAGAPRVELGYRLPQGFGEFLVSYRSLVSEGTDFLPVFDLDGGGGFLKSRLNVNVLDLDYASREFTLGPEWDMKWRIGARLASAYYDARALGFFLEQRVSNDFRGAGPHLALDLRRRLAGTGLAWYGHAESAAVIGKIKQAFGESILLPDGTLFGTAANVRQNQVAPVLSFETGLSWVPLGSSHLRFAVGYEYEIWWSLGQTATANLELTDQGVFLRAEWSF